MLTPLSAAAAVADRFPVPPRATPLSMHTTTRWIAYDNTDSSPPSDHSDNAEIEPGNRKHASVSWSDTAEIRSCQWGGIEGATHTTRPTSGAFAASLLPHRTMTVEFSGDAVAPMQTLRLVAFVPARFLNLPPVFGGECEAHRESKLRALLTSFEAASNAISGPGAGGAYIRFRWLWMLCRDGGALSHSASVLRRLRRHPNLSAPVETHDPKALHARMSALVMPAATEAPGSQSSSASASASTAASAESSSSPAASAAAPRSAYHAFLASCGPGLLPETPLRCSLGDPTAMALEVLTALVHAQTCATLNWPLDTTQWATTAAAAGSDAAAESSHGVARWRLSFDSACSAVESWLLTHIAHRASFAQFVLHRFQELMHPRAVIHLLNNALPLDWTDATFQAAIVRLMLHASHNSSSTSSSNNNGSNPTQEYPCSLDHAWSFWSALQKELEWSQTPEIDDALPTEIGRLLAQRKKVAARPQQTIDAHYWTAFYRPEIISETEDDEQSAQDLASNAVPFDFRSVTLRMSSGFGSTTGLTLWPAGFLLCEWVLQHPDLFRGRRVLELGCGIGLTSVLLHRAGASTLVCTDGDEQVVLNLHANFRINGLPDITPIATSADADANSNDTLGPGVFVAQLLWGSDESVDLIRRAAPEVIVSCDTIYLPEFHEELACTLKEALTPRTIAAASDASGAAASSAVSAGSSSSARVAYFAQVNRNPDTFASYLRTFAKHGLKMEPMRYREAAARIANTQAEADASSFIPCRFAYDRECLQMHRIVLEESAAMKTES